MSLRGNTATRSVTFILIIIPPQIKYWFYPVCFYVCLSVCPPSVDMILMMFLKMGVWIFLKICTLITPHLKMCNRNFHIDWIIFLHLTVFFSCFGPRCFYSKKYIVLQCKYKYYSVLKILKNFELKIENVLFLTETLYLLLWYTILLFPFCK